jgi:ompA family protein
LFEKGSYVLKQETQNLLKEFAKTYLQTNKEAVLLVEGYTCDLGTDKLNDRLSERRAESIKNSLIAEGVPTDKVEIKWYGESQYNNSPYKTREENRRVNVSVK